MRIKAIYSKDIPPVKLISVEELSDIVVFAGPNGVGKTRFIKWLLGFFTNPQANPDHWLLVESTSTTERSAWGQAVLDTRQSADVAKLRATMQQNRRRAHFESSVLNFESDRTIAQIAPLQFNFDYQDPFEEPMGWNFGFQSLTARFQDTVHSIFRKIKSRRESIALKVDQMIREREHAVRVEQTGLQSEVQERKTTVEIKIEDFPDPLIPFKDAFFQLLAPKELVEPELKNQQLFVKDGAAQFPLTDLSSGEREVVNIVFDFLLRSPNDCIVVFDEPELHLHPELSYKLIQTLRNAGARNQFIFCTHSADIISASLENSVVFISPPKASGENQAIVVKEDDETHRALKLMGQSIGIVSLGRRIVLIEGEESSLDKQTYGAILKARYPNLVLVPSGGKGLIQSFASLEDEVLSKSLWGVEFFMLCDRDAVPATAIGSDLVAKAHGKLRLLGRYHLENYFLEEHVIAQIFSDIEPESSWLRSPEKIRAKLKDIAREQLSYATALIVSAVFRERVGNLSIMPKGCNGKSANELSELLLAAASGERGRIETTIEPRGIANYTEETMRHLEGSLAGNSDEWKKLVPGRLILRIFCSSAHADFDFGRFKIGYLRAAEKQPASPFAEIEKIFEDFSTFVSQ